MSVLYSDCSSDLLCGEESGILSCESPDCLLEFESSAAEIEESIAILIEDERNFVPGYDYLMRFRNRSIDAMAREDSVSWILKVIAYYGFQPLTAYLAINYFDRFLYSRRLPESNGWSWQLLSVACLSLAAKMEEPLVPSLLDLQIEGAKHIFEPRTIRRMEFLVLSVLDWRIRSITPFCFINFFAFKLDSTGSFMGFLISRATDIILSNIQEANFLEYWPSCIAATAVICAANEIPHLCLVNPEHAESWCDGLCKEKIISCYRLMQELVLENYQSKAPKVIPQLRVTIRGRMRSSDSSPPSSYKRRKLNNCLWVHDDKGNSE